MTLLELQENYLKACFYYASYVNGFDAQVDETTFCEIGSVENVNAGQPGEPNNLYVITTWNHSSVQPTDAQLMAYSVAQVQQFWRVMVDLPTLIKLSSLFRITEAEKVQIHSSKLEDGFFIFNETNDGIEVYVNGAWKSLEFSGSALSVYVGSASNESVLKISPKFLCTTATVSNGVAVFNLTVDGLANGDAIFANIYDQSVRFEINNATHSYRWSWTISADKKTLTATVNQATSVSILGIQVLGGLAQATNGTIVRLNVCGD